MFDNINKNKKLSQQKKIDQFIDTIKADEAYLQLIEDGKIAIIKTALENNFTLDTLKEVVNRVAWNESNIAGNTIDALIRASLSIDENGFVVPSKPDNMSEKAYDKLLGSEGIITKLQNWAKDGDFFFYAGDALIFDKTALSNGVVGAMDIFAFNKKTKEFYIIDIKTAKDFSGKSIESKMYQYSAQQSIYRNLVHNMMGVLPSKLSLLPIQVDISLDGYINDIENATSILNKTKLNKLNTKIDSLKGEKGKEDELKSLQKQVKAIKTGLAVDVEYIEEVEKGVPLKVPTNIPIELQGEVSDEGEIFDPFLTEELKGKFKDSKNIEKVEAIAKRIRKAKTLTEADKARSEAFLLVMLEPAIASDINTMLEEEYEAKKLALTNEVSPGNLSKGMYLISENPIFDNAENIVIIDKVYKKKDGTNMVTVKSIGLKKVRQESMTVEKSNKLFTKVTAEDAEQSIKVSAEAKAAAKKSKENQTEFNKQNNTVIESDESSDDDLYGELPEEDC
jgi:hypothetical protein